MHTGLHVKYPLFLSDFNKNCIFSTDFRKILKHQISLIHPGGAELFHADGRPDGKTWRSYWSLIAILRTRLQI